jgi:hypothetical protein
VQRLAQPARHPRAVRPSRGDERVVLAQSSGSYMASNLSRETA